MSTLRERVRDALSAREPSAREAASDLDEIVGRRRRRPLGPIAYGLVLAATIAIALVVYRARRDPSVASAPPPTPAVEAAGFQLYIHVTGEPEQAAVAMDITTSKGARK